MRMSAFTPSNDVKPKLRKLPRNTTVQRSFKSGNNYWQKTRIPIEIQDMNHENLHNFEQAHLPNFNINKART